MNKELLQKIKENLLSQKKEILMVLANENEDFDALLKNKDPKDLVDIASDDIDKRMLETLEIQDLKRLRLIEMALSRIENDRYGLCMECSNKISLERLEAIPYALLCLNCKSKEEKRKR